MLKTFVTFFCLLLFSPALLYAAHHHHHGPELVSGFNTKPLVFGKHSMIVTNNRFASQTAEKILASGGNAIDAAIAAAFVLGLTEPQSSGIGGGGYAVIYDEKNKKIMAFDGRETAPHSATPDWFLDTNGQALTFQQAVLSPKSIGVPGEVALLSQLHRQYGKLAWEKLLAPAIALAKQGFPMSPRLYKLLSADIHLLQNKLEIKKTYFTGNTIKKINTIIKNPAYAETLTLIAKTPEDFYQGKLAQDIMNVINNTAHLTLFNKSDFSNYRVKVYPALCFSFREKYKICSVPPSSSGGITVQELMRIYADSYVTSNYNDKNWSYYFLEASKLAFADRNQYLADPDFIKQPIDGLLAPAYLRERSKIINTHALVTPVAAGVPAGIDATYAPDASSKAPGTTSLAIVDSTGNAISLTLTVESQFGSHLFTHGFFLNNELTDFSFHPKAASGQPIANRVEAGKRPRSSIAPVIVFNQQNQLYALSGSPGGSEIICFVAKNLILMLDMKMTPDEASQAMNLCATNSNPIIESNFKAPQLISFLKAKGENIQRLNLVSGVTNILKDADGGWYGAADPRREGVAIGN